MPNADDSKQNKFSDPRSDRRRIIILSFAGLLFFLMFTAAFPEAVGTFNHIVFEKPQNDMLPYYLGGYMLAANNPGVYDPAAYGSFYGRFPLALGIHDTLNYPPFIYAIFSLFASLNFSGAAVLWYFLSQIFMIISIVLIFLAIDKFYDSGREKVFSWRIVLYIIAAAAFSPYVETLFQGQVNALLLMLISLSLYFYASDNETGAGIAAGLAAAIKLTPGILLIFFLTRKRYRACISFAVSIFAVYVLIALRWGPKLILDYVKYTPGGYGQFVTYFKINNQGVPAFIGRLFRTTGLNKPLIEAPALVAPITIGILLAVLGGLLWFSLKQKKRVVRGSYDLILFSLYICSIFIFSPLVWGHHLVYFILTAIIIIEHFIRNGKISRSQLAVGALIVFLLALTGAFNGRIPTATRVNMAKIRLWMAESMVNQAVTLLLWFLQAAFLFILPGEKVDKDNDKIKAGRDYE